MGQLSRDNHAVRDTDTAGHIPVDEGLHSFIARPGINGEDAYRTSTKGNPMRDALLLIRLRWAGGAIIIAGAILCRFLGVIADATGVIAVGAGVWSYNAVFALAVRTATLQRLGSRGGLVAAQIVVDVIALSGVIYFCGGVENPIVCFYVLQAAFAAMILPTKQRFLVATVATICFALVAGVQAAFPSLYHPLELGFAAHYFDRWPPVVLEVAILATCLYASAAFVATIASRFRPGEQEIDSRLDLLERLIASMSAAVVFLDPDGSPRLCNRAGAVWLLGASSDENLTTSDDPVAPEGIRRFIEEARSASAPLSDRMLWVKTPAGPQQPDRQLRVSTSSVLGEHGDHLGYVVMGEDFPEHLQLEEMRAKNRQIRDISEAFRKSQEGMAQREKMAAIGTMAAGVAHEIGNPLTCLSAIVQLLRRRSRNKDDHEQLAILDEQIKRIVKILRELLEFARPGIGKRMLVDLDDTTERAIRMVNYSHRSRHARIDSRRNRNLPSVHTVPEKFQQVLINLLLNALDACRGVDDPVVVVERTVENGWVAVKITDEGTGMTKKEIRQAFEPFYTTKAPGEGTGLGLAVSYRIVETLGGRIKIDSSPGKGTVATVSFPAVGSTVETVAAPNAPGTSPS